MARILLMAVVVLIFGCSSPMKFKQISEQQKLNWNNPEFEFAVAYLFNINESYSESLIIVKGQLNEFVEKKTELSKKEISQFVKYFLQKENPKSPPIAPAECFYPRHGIVFYGKTDNVLGHISICFTCHQLKIYPKEESLEDIHLESFDYLKSFFNNLDFPLFNNPDEFEVYIKSKKQ